ncbi:MAG: S41 family peptidase [Anaerolineales bacterium]|jgi:C-terminal processing protease CtpA/Prc
MPRKWKAIITILGITILLAACQGPGSKNGSSAEDAPFSPANNLEMAEIVNDEGGPVTISGSVTYTNPFFTKGVAQPLVILEDQAGFVDRDRNFIFPTASQVLGQITTDFYTSPFEYSLTLPEVPRGTLRDVDQDNLEEEGVMTYAVAYWTNTWGDPYLEKRDQHGGGWSTAYASTKVSDDRDTYLEVYGGIYLIYAPQAGQGFPSGFGPDDMLFTEDDPIVEIPQGWTIVDLDTDPFTFDRSREPVIPLLEPEKIALDDFSDLPYSEAFDEMLTKLKHEYAFTELKGIDWDQLAAEYRPRFVEAEASQDRLGYFLALRDFLWSIPDGHISMDISPLAQLFREQVSGGLGLALQRLDDGSVLVDYVLEEGPADEVGIQVGAEVFSINQVPILDAVENTVPWSSPFSTEHTRLLEQLRYVTRFPLDTQVELEFRNPFAPIRTVTLTTVREFESFNFMPVEDPRSGTELPVEFSVLEEGLGYVNVSSFSDNEVLTIQLWERMIQDLKEQGIPGLIIDMRFNVGGSGFLADQMAAYFFDEELATGNSSFYDDSIDDFYMDPGDERYMIPPREELQYNGEVAVLVGPDCFSACEFFSYAMTIQDRATIVGHYPTGGLGGSVEDFLMPEDNSVRFTIGRAVNPEGEIHIEGKGIIPDIDVPVSEETLLAEVIEDRDTVLEAALELLSPTPANGSISEDSPQIASPSEADAAVENGVPLLEQLAPETYTNPFSSPGVYTYTPDLSQTGRALWVAGWCDESGQFEESISNIEFEMRLNANTVPLSNFSELDYDSEGQRCRFYVSLLTDWPAGEHLVETEMDFINTVAEGFDPGVRLFEYHVVID